MLAPITAIAVAVSLLAAYLRRRRAHYPAQTVIVSPRRSTVVSGDGQVSSVQSADLSVQPSDLGRIWGTANLENLARTYWCFLSRVTLGLVRVYYAAETRSVCLLSPRITLLRFDKPQYTVEDDHGLVRWRIRDGLLVARSGRGSGFLALDVRRRAPDDNGRTVLHIKVEVTAFYPSIAVGFGVPVYRMTQSSLHSLVTHAFLRSLGRLDLAQSRIGALAQQITERLPRS
ncbi:MAG: hypothetical protein M3022_08440 [Actinomycetota bacterium]|nr:hypothetical protein [Actinomycetota bacterium]